MTELEKIEYTKAFIDKLANGINPLDDTPIPEGDIANNVRLSRCFFYVSSILEREIARELKKLPKEPKPARIAFAVTPEQLEKYEYEAFPISASVLARKIVGLADGAKEKNMERFSYRKINRFLENIGMIEWREWENGKLKRFTTREGEDIGLEVRIWENYGRCAPIIGFTEAAQRFILDNLDAVIATEIKKGKTSEPSDDDEEDGEG
jgi:hypothetical protein